MLVATAAWGQAHRPATDAFRVSWDLETDPVDRRIEGRVHNDDREQHTRHRGHLAHLSPAPRGEYREERDGPFGCSPAPRH